MILINNSDILYFTTASDKLPAQSRRIEDDYAIFFNETFFDTESERYIALAHEKGHCDSGALYNIDTSLMTRRWCERRAWRWTILNQLPLDELMGAFEACRTSEGVSIHDLADYLDIEPFPVR